MTIASKLETISDSLSDIKTAIIAKGQTPSGDITTYATAIGNISSGSSPVISPLSVTPTTSSQTITAPSGTDGYSPISVSAVTSSIDSNIVAGNIKNGVSILGVTGNYEGSGGGGSFIGIPREVKNGVYQMPTESFTFSLPDDATDVGQSGLYYAFSRCTGLTSVDLSSLTTVSGSNGFDSAFNGCTALTSVDLSSLTTVSGTNGLYYAFSGCTALTSVDLPSLTTVSGSSALSSAFRNCTGLTNIYFRALTTSSFGSYTNQFSSMMSGTGSSTTHTLHFPSNLQSTIKGLSGYPAFGGTSSKVRLLFDLPATS